MNIKGKKILLGVTGGIAAYKACELLRILQKRGAEVRVVMTNEATKFVGQTTFAALSNFPVYVNSEAETKPFNHIDYSRWADIYIIAPCSATSISRFVTGSGEECVSLCFLAMQGEKWIVPSMNSVMYDSFAVQRNLKLLGLWGVNIIEPAVGYLACKEEGKGKFPEPENIVDELEFGAYNKTEKTKTMLITIGRTQEAIDPVRYISNKSSGKTGVAIAKEFMRNGWSVIAVCGPMEATLPLQCKRIDVKSAKEMNEAVLKNQKDADVIVHCAAVADYRTKKIALQKIKQSKAKQTLKLEETENILNNTIKNKKEGQKIVSFALETENAYENAIKKFKNKGIDVLVVNTAASGNGGFGENNVEYGILNKDYNKEEKNVLAYGSKNELAANLFKEIL